MCTGATAMRDLISLDPSGTLLTAQSHPVEVVDRRDESTHTIQYFWRGNQGAVIEYLKQKATQTLLDGHAFMPEEKLIGV